VLWWLLLVDHESRPTPAAVLRLPSVGPLAPARIDQDLAHPQVRRRAKRATSMAEEHLPIAPESAIAVLCSTADRARVSLAEWNPLLHVV
jgi:hypothetical protein